MNRWRNYGLWTAIAALILLVLQSFGIEIDVGRYNDIVTAVLGVLALAGVISNPMNGRGFTDTKTQDYEGQ
ncbi:holin [Aneurinibacillus aneurinilyticus]|uniref:holin n=1 Tax=Aneurinibacillus aneurinilyticus TaxID=1391 RepID=UPI00366C78F5